MTQNDLYPIKLHLADELVPDRREKGKYLCPICGSGSEPGKHDGAFSIMPDRIHGKCFSCDFYGDIFDLEAAKTKKSLSEATRDVIARYSTGSDIRPVVRPVAPIAAAAVSAQKVTTEKQSLSAYAKECHAAIKGSPGEEYLKSRGFTDETIEKFSLGYDPAKYFSGDGKLPAIVLPYDPEGNYVAWRSIQKKQFRKPPTDKYGEEPVFNAAVLSSADFVFVVESQLCALSIEQSGGHAVAIGGSGEQKLYDCVKANPPAGVLILSFDNDEVGKSNTAKVSEGLDALGVKYIVFNVADIYKDPNDLLQADPDALRANVKGGIFFAGNEQRKAQERKREEYEASTTAASFDQFEAFLTANADKPPISTGFKALDNKLNGGLSAGLYIMGAISSLGKTAWMLNIADNIAAAGRDVLYFSLEMSRYDLIARSISRLSFKAIGDSHSPIGDAFSSFDVLNCRGGRGLTLSQQHILQTAFSMYREGSGKHMWIFEGVGQYGVDQIRDVVENHIQITGRSPVVFIDYLQILAPFDPKSSDKQNTDKAVVELKRLSAQKDIPVFCISSLNRQGYSEPITMAAFKESGAIEYGSDVLIGIQLSGIGYEPGEKQQEHTNRVRRIVDAAEEAAQVDIEIKILKNRCGTRGLGGVLTFNKKYNSFSEIPAGFTRTSSVIGFDDDDEPVLPLKR